MRAKSKTKIHVVEVSSASWRSAQGKAELTREALEVFTPPDARPNHAIVARTLCNSIVARTDVAARVHFSEVGRFSVARRLRGAVIQGSSVSNGCATAAYRS